MTRHLTSLATVAALAAATATAPAIAQGGPGGGPGGGWGSGMMMGPGMMGGRGMGFMCNPRAAGMAEWRLDRMEQAVKPNDTQKAALKELRDASTKAAETMNASCSSDVPAQPVERMVLMEKRLEASLAAVRTVRPAFEKFYATLDAEQKTKLESVGPRRWGWERWHWPWRN